MIEYAEIAERAAKWQPNDLISPPNPVDDAAAAPKAFKKAEQDAAGARKGDADSSKNKTA